MIGYMLSNSSKHRHHHYKQQFFLYDIYSKPSVKSLLEIGMPNPHIFQYLVDTAPHIESMYIVNIFIKIS